MSEQIGLKFAHVDIKLPRRDLLCAFKNWASDIDWDYYDKSNGIDCLEFKANYGTFLVLLRENAKKDTVKIIGLTSRDGKEVWNTSGVAKVLEIIQGFAVKYRGCMWVEWYFRRDGVTSQRYVLIYRGSSLLAEGHPNGVAYKTSNGLLTRAYEQIEGDVGADRLLCSDLFLNEKAPSRIENFFGRHFSDDHELHRFIEDVEELLHKKELILKRSLELDVICNEYYERLIRGKRFNFYRFLIVTSNGGAHWATLAVSMQDNTHKYTHRYNTGTETAHDLLVWGILGEGGESGDLPIVYSVFWSVMEDWCCRKGKSVFSATAPLIVRDGKVLLKNVNGVVTWF